MHTSTKLKFWWKIVGFFAQSLNLALGLGFDDKIGTTFARDVFYEIPYEEWITENWITGSIRQTSVHFWVSLTVNHFQMSDRRIWPKQNVSVFLEIAKGRPIQVDPTTDLFLMEIGNPCCGLAFLCLLQNKSRVDIIYSLVEKADPPPFVYCS